MVFNVMIKTESAPASQKLLATNVNDVLMDFMDFQTVKVGFCYQYFWHKCISLSSFNNFFQTVNVIQKDLMISNVTMKMDSAPASQTFSVARSVINVLMDSMDFQTVKVGFSSKYFLNSYSYTKIFFIFMWHKCISLPFFNK